MILKLHHNFSGYEIELTINEFTQEGVYYKFSIPFPSDAPYGEYNYVLIPDDADSSTSQPIIASGILNYSQYAPVNYVVSDKTVFTIYEN